MYKLQFDNEICNSCQTIDCLMKCQYIEFDLESARIERNKLNNGEDSSVLHDCVTCYACEEYCPYGNHPFYQIVDLQEELDIWPTPKPAVEQSVNMFIPRGNYKPEEVEGTPFNMCVFRKEFSDKIDGKLFENTTQIGGRDLFCNLMYLHFAKNSVIKERVPQVIKNFADSGVKELVCFHDECYGTYTSWASAYGIDVPFKPIHLFEYLYKKLKENEDSIQKLDIKIAFQRPCSTRLNPEPEEQYLDKIFELIGADRVPRKYDRENALCCGGIMRMSEREKLADEITKKNIDDMVATGAKVCVFNCQACYATMGKTVNKAGLKPILIGDLCRMALGEKI